MISTSATPTTNPHQHVTSPNPDCRSRESSDADATNKEVIDFLTKYSPRRADFGDSGDTAKSEPKSVFVSRLACGWAVMSVSSPADRLEHADAFLSRPPGQLRSAAGRDACLRACPVLAIPGYYQPLIKVDDCRVHRAEHLPGQPGAAFSRLSPSIRSEVAGVLAMSLQRQSFGPTVSSVSFLQPKRQSRRRSPAGRRARTDLLGSLPGRPKLPASPATLCLRVAYGGFRIRHPERKSCARRREAGRFRHRVTLYALRRPRRGVCSVHAVR